MRAADTDRERTAERLRDAAVEGRIRSDELEERLEAALAASTYDELDRLVADLPAPPETAAAPAAPADDLPRRICAARAHLGADRRGLLLADLADPRLGPLRGSAARAGRLPGMPSERFVDELNAQIGRELRPPISTPPWARSTTARRSRAWPSSSTTRPTRSAGTR